MARDPADPASRITHHLKTPLTVILGRAQLVARSVEKCSGLSAAERAAVLSQIATIEAMAHSMDGRIDDLAREARDRGPGCPRG